MKNIVLYLFLRLFLNITYAQEMPKDTATFIINQVKSLSNATYTYDCYRLNFEDCNLEIQETNLKDDSKWKIYAVWLMDLDETKMRILPQPNGEYGLMLESSLPRKIKYSSHRDSGRRNLIPLFSSDRQKLIDLGQAIYYATKKCKQSGRASDY